jgi:uncharacterized membrane protein YfcA
MTLPPIDLQLALAGLIVGLLVGLTGMGGGALMTPILVLIFGVQPLAAVSSDLVASFFMKPVGAVVHFRRGTVHLRLVAWLIVGSVPSAFLGVLALRAFGDPRQIQQVVQLALGVALIGAAGAIVLKALINLRQRARGLHMEPAVGVAEVPVKPLPTILIGALVGLVVGMTSVGSGSLMIVCLLFLYPRLRANQLVGTDIVQAIPLVGSAALGHLLYGDFRLILTASLLIGAIPGVYLGARASAHAPARLVRRALAFVLLASGLKLVQLGTVELGVVLLIVAVAGEPGWAVVRRSNGLLFGSAAVPARREERAA